MLRRYEKREKEHTFEVAHVGILLCHGLVEDPSSIAKVNGMIAYQGKCADRERGLEGRCLQMTVSKRQGRQRGGSERDKRVLRTRC